MTKRKQPKPVMIPVNEGGDMLKKLIQHLNPDVEFAWVTVNGDWKIDG